MRRTRTPTETAARKWSKSRICGQGLYPPRLSWPHTTERILPAVPFGGLIMLRLRHADWRRCVHQQFHCSVSKEYTTPSRRTPHLRPYAAGMHAGSHIQKADPAAWASPPAPHPTYAIIQPGPQHPSRLNRHGAGNTLHRNAVPGRPRYPA